jgi:hypothetical protein
MRMDCEEKKGQAFKNKIIFFYEGNFLLDNMPSKYTRKFLGMLYIVKIGNTSM